MLGCVHPGCREVGKPSVLLWGCLSHVIYVCQGVHRAASTALAAWVSFLGLCAANRSTQQGNEEDVGPAGTRLQLLALKTAVGLKPGSRFFQAWLREMLPCLGKEAPLCSTTLVALDFYTPSSAVGISLHLPLSPCMISHVSWTLRPSCWLSLILGMVILGLFQSPGGDEGIENKVASPGIVLLAPEQAPALPQQQATHYPTKAQKCRKPAAGALGHLFFFLLFLVFALLLAEGKQISQEWGWILQGAVALLRLARLAPTSPAWAGHAKGSLLLPGFRLLCGHCKFHQQGSKGNLAHLPLGWLQGSRKWLFVGSLLL